MYFLLYACGEGSAQSEVHGHSDVPEAQPDLGGTTALHHVLKRCRALCLDVGFCAAAMQSSTFFLQGDTHTSIYGRQVWREALLQNPGVQVNQEG